MPSKPTRIPTYRRHTSGQARVTLNGKDHLLGPYGSKESREAYDRLIAEWLVHRGKIPTNEEEEKEPLSVNELILAYWKFAVDYYGFEAGNRGDTYCLRDTLRVVRSLYGGTKARNFGPLSLKACRERMVEKGWSRTYTNAQVDRIRRMFRWAGEEELVPGGVYQNLRAVAGLRFGKTDARETKKVKPVPPEDIEAARPHMPPVVRSMVDIELLTGCRPAEVCIMRPIDIDMRNPSCWVYRPGSDQGPNGTHKTAHHGHERMIFIGPKAQEILRPYLGTKLDAYCFSPAESETRRNLARRETRQTPLTPMQRRRKPKTRRRRAPSDHYDTHSYRRAIARACRKADKAAHQENPAIPPDQVLVPVWSPNRLRHNRATELRSHGLDVTKTVLGHAKVETTQVYAEKDLAAAMELVSRIG
jgi:integrase